MALFIYSTMAKNGRRHSLSDIVDRKVGECPHVEGIKIKQLLFLKPMPPKCVSDEIWESSTIQWQALYKNMNLLTYLDSYLMTDEE